MSAVIICEPDPECRDQNVNRWYCMRGHEGAAPDVCLLKRCGGPGLPARSDLLGDTENGV